MEQRKIQKTNFSYGLKVVSIGLLEYLKHLVPLIKISKSIQNQKEFIPKVLSKEPNLEIKEKLEYIWKQKYITDKVSHGYENIYAKIFNGLASSRFNILEFGIGGNGIDKPDSKHVSGKSLRTWAELCPLATIYGFDIDESTFFNDVNRIHTLKLDQTKLSDINLRLSSIPYNSEGLEIWIDDGLHEPSGFLPTIRAFLESNRTKNKLLIVEDLWYPYALINFIIFRVILPKNSVTFYNFKNIQSIGIKNSLFPLKDFYGGSNLIVITL